MLRLTIHAGPLKSTSRFNLVAALDVGYEKLAPVADYKATLFVAGVGVTSPVMLRGYARWSASLWDLLARALALTLSPDAARPIEEVPPVAPGGKRSAFATGLSGLIEHLPGGDELRRTTLGTVAVEQAKRRCTYRKRPAATVLTCGRPSEWRLPGDSLRQ
ncbi:MAG: hypothetical protein KJ018_05505 [Burkholderiales bacterium]|nr:hypothetical protein [Burkholderiales bacterium]